MNSFLNNLTNLTLENVSNNMIPLNPSGASQLSNRTVDQVEEKTSIMSSTSEFNDGLTQQLLAQPLAQSAVQPPALQPLAPQPLAQPADNAAALAQIMSQLSSQPPAQTAALVQIRSQLSVQPTVKAQQSTRSQPTVQAQQSDEFSSDQTNNYKNKLFNIIKLSTKSPQSKFTMSNNFSNMFKLFNKQYQTRESILTAFKNTDVMSGIYEITHQLYSSMISHLYNLLVHEELDTNSNLYECRTAIGELNKYVDSSFTDSTCVNPLTQIHENILVSLMMEFGNEDSLDINKLINAYLARKTAQQDSVTLFSFIIRRMSFIINNSDGDLCGYSRNIFRELISLQNAGEDNNPNIDYNILLSGKFQYNGIITTNGNNINLLVAKKDLCKEIAALRKDFISQNCSNKKTPLPSPPPPRQQIHASHQPAYQAYVYHMQQQQAAYQQAHVYQQAQQAYPTQPTQQDRRQQAPQDRRQQAQQAYPTQPTQPNQSNQSIQQARHQQARQARHQQQAHQSH